MSESERLAAAHRALAAGDVIAAYDLATEGGTEDSPEFGYVEVRALAAMGDWRGGLARYAACGLESRGDVDSIALKGRLLKDAAFAAPPDEARARFAEASAAYATAWRGPADFYAAINAAATAALAGNAADAERHARAALEGAQDAGADYWALVTQAEAHLLLRAPGCVAPLLAQAAAQPGVAVAARAATHRQLSALATATAQTIDLAPVRPPRTAHFCGHIFAQDPTAEARIAEAARDALAAEQIGWAFGSLAAGADIVIAETCLAAEIELHVVLPFDEDDFVAASVRRGGPGWEARYRRCLAGAARVHRASLMRFVDDDHQYAFGSAVAMGLARLRATQVSSEAVQIAAWDGLAASGVAGTAADVAAWAAAGGRSVVLPGSGLPRPALSQAPGAAKLSGPPRALRVMAFTDFKGFSRLPEAAVPVFWREVMGGAADVLAASGAALTCRNTWGDALYLAFDAVPAAAEALLRLAEAIAGRDLAAQGLPPGGGMRIAAHYGAVYEMDDPVTGAVNYCGSEVSRAARVEPVTPPGQVWVTEPMAAAVEMTCAARFACRYVGRVALAKGYGTERIFRLERARG